MNPEINSATAVLDPAPAAPATKGRRTTAANDDPSRCQHRLPNGKRCRLPGLDSQFGLCLRHFNLSAAVGASRLQTPSDSEDLSAELLPQLSEFDGAMPINQFLSRLLIFVTKGRVTPRRAAVLAYITNQLLHSQRAFHRELGDKEKAATTHLDFSNWPAVRFVNSDTPPPLPPEGDGPAVLRRARAYQASLGPGPRNFGEGLPK